MSSCDARWRGVRREWGLSVVLLEPNLYFGYWRRLGLIPGAGERLYNNTDVSSHLQPGYAFPLAQAQLPTTQDLLLIGFVHAQLSNPTIKVMGGSRTNHHLDLDSCASPT
jgi:hypothetical protein